MVYIKAKSKNTASEKNTNYAMYKSFLTISKP